MMKTFAFALWMGWFCGVAGAAWAVESGSPAPTFQLPGHDGKTYDLKEQKGKWVVLEWFNNDCPYVDKHYSTETMQNLQKEFTSKGVQWFVVVSSAPGKQGYADAKGIKAIMGARKATPTAVLLDPTGKVGTAYSAKTTPHMYVIDPAGKLVYQGAIDDKPSARHSTVKDATPLFANAMRAAMAGKKIADDTTVPYGCSVKYAD